MSPGDLSREAGRLLRTVREGRGLSQARLAARVGASQQWLSQVERGLRNPTLRDLERFFGGLGLRLRFEVVPESTEALEDPDLTLREPEEERIASVFGYCHLLRKLHGVPHVVGGRLAALAHGLPVRVRRLDLIVASEDLELFAEAMYQFSSQRWSERWQSFCDQTSAHRPGPMRWLISGSWELRVAVLDDLPDRMNVRLGDHELWIPPLPWLVAHDPDIADLLDRLERVGFSR